MCKKKIQPLLEDSLRKLKGLAAYDENEAQSSIDSGVKLENRYFSRGEKLEDARTEHEIGSLKHSLRYEKLYAKIYLKLQTKYSGNLFCLAVVWLLIVNFIIFLAGFKPLGFHLDNSVLIAFITSTTASVLGLFVIVVNWLFGKSN